MKNVRSKCGTMAKRLAAVAVQALLMASYATPIVYGAGLGDLATTVTGWMSGSKALALGIGSVNLVVGVLMKHIPAVSRRMREMGLEIIENGLILVGLVGVGAGLLMMAADVGSKLSGQGGISIENPWK